MKPIETKKDYQNYVNQKSPNSPVIKNCLNSFWVGGVICSIGQIIMEYCKFRGLDVQISGTITSIILILLLLVVVFIRAIAKTIRKFSNKNKHK